jgi:hypothetical protein
VGLCRHLPGCSDKVGSCDRTVTSGRSWSRTRVITVVASLNRSHPPLTATSPISDDPGHPLRRCRGPGRSGSQVSTRIRSPGARGDGDLQATTGSDELSSDDADAFLTERLNGVPGQSFEPTLHRFGGVGGPMRFDPVGLRPRPLVLRSRADRGGTEGEGNVGEGPIAAPGPTPAEGAPPPSSWQGRSRSCHGSVAIRTRPVGVGRVTVRSRPFEIRQRRARNAEVGCGWKPDEFDGPASGPPSDG